jgi:DNA-directed RNA polymerase specialized sigma24 family protein
MNSSENSGTSGGGVPSQSEMPSARHRAAADRKPSETLILGAVCACRLGERAAWERLLQHYHPMCHSTARELLCDRYASWVEDVAQQSLMIIYRKLDTWQGSEMSSLDGWVRRIVQRESLRMIRQICRWEVSVDGPTLAAHDEGYEDEGLQWLETWDDVGAFRLTLCSTHHRRVLMHLVAGDHPTSIASALGLPASTVRRMIRAVRKRFQRFRER